MIHPDHSNEARVMIDSYVEMVKVTKGSVHRLEDWGRRHLAYPINKIHKAHYVLMNIECLSSCISELKDKFRYDDAVIRNMILRVNTAITGNSPIKNVENRDDKRRQDRTPIDDTKKTPTDEAITS
jgi:small subunit ribosomal protein S6